MRATSMLRFIIFGAVGFGIGGILPLPLNLLIGGAVGGAALGLALKDRERVVSLAMLGELGLIVGFMAGLIISHNFFGDSYSEVAMMFMVGAVIGASLGVAFLDWRTIVALAVAGAVGFSVGSLPGGFLGFSIPIIRQLLGAAGSIAVAGLVGGASLGAALGYLEHRKLTGERSARVR
jgi:hypothetical protein